MNSETTLYFTPRITLDPFYFSSIFFLLETEERFPQRRSTGFATTNPEKHSQETTRKAQGADFIDDIQAHIADEALNQLGKPSGNANMMLRRLIGRHAPCLAARSSSIGDALVVSAAASHSTPILAAVQLFASAVTHGRAAAFNTVFVNQNRNFSSPPSSGKLSSEGQANAVSKPNIHAVPKPHFFQNGSTGGRVGANVDRMRKAYSPQQLGTNRFRRNKKIKKIDLPTHYMEVNHKIKKAIMFYGPHIAHIPLHISMKDLNLLCWSEHVRRYK